MLFSIKDRVAVVTGGTGVLGNSVAEYLAKQGVKVAMLSRSKEKAERLARNLSNLDTQVLGLGADVLNRSSLEESRHQIIQQWGKIDMLINAAGGNMPSATIGADQTIFDLNMEDFKKVYELNLDGSVLPSLVFGEEMAKQRKGNIINISSMTVQQAVTRVAGYSASKAAIENLTRWMAVDVAIKYGESMRVNAIAPGFFISEQNRKLLVHADGSYTERGNKIIEKTPMKRFGKAEELHGAIHWLCSEASQFVTGAVIPIDGGFSAFSGV